MLTPARPANGSSTAPTGQPEAASVGDKTAPPTGFHAPGPGSGPALIEPVGEYPYESATLAFAPAGRVLFVGTGKRALRIDLDTGETRTVVERPAHVLALSRDGSHLAVGDADAHKMNLCDAGTGQILRTLDLTPETRGRTAMAFSPDGDTLAVDGLDGFYLVRPKGEPKRQRFMHEGSGVPRIEGMDFSPDGKVLAMGVLDVFRWDMVVDRKLRTLEGHSSHVGAVRFSPDGKLLASGGDDKTVRIWDAQSGKPMRTMRRHSNAITSLAFTPDGQALVSAAGQSVFMPFESEGEVIVWHTESGRQLARLASPKSSAFNSVAVSPDGVTVAASQVGTVRVWDLSPLAGRPPAPRPVFGGAAAP